MRSDACVAPTRPFDRDCHVRRRNPRSDGTTGHTSWPRWSRGKVGKGEMWGVRMTPRTAGNPGLWRCMRWARNWVRGRGVRGGRRFGCWAARGWRWRFLRLCRLRCSARMRRPVGSRSGWWGWGGRRCMPISSRFCSPMRRGWWRCATSTAGGWRRPRRKWTSTTATAIVLRRGTGARWLGATISTRS
jgi:hypothetical protein